MARRIECPDCGETVELNESNIILTHDNAPPCRSVCRASGADATRLVTAVAEALAAERAAIRAEIERRRSTESAACGDASTQGFAAGFVERAHRDLLAWLDERSKGGAR